MKYTRRGIVFTAALLVGPPLAAQDGLLVVDSADEVLGPVVAIKIDAANTPVFVFAYDQGGQTALLSTRFPERVSEMSSGFSGPIYIFYSSVNCTGAPVMTTHGDCCAASLVPFVFPDGLGQLWVADTLQYIDPLVGSKREVGFSDTQGSCEPITPAATQGFAISLWGTLNFMPPVRIERNPFIFGDDFSSQNLGAWSNY